jgi:hypothetical protein
VQLAEQLIGRELSDDKRKRDTIDDFIGKLDGMSASGNGAGEHAHSDRTPAGEAR